MEFKKKLLKINGIGKIIANKIVSYAPTKDILIQKLHSNYQEMIDLFRDDVVELLYTTFVKTGVLKNVIQKKSGNKQSTSKAIKQKDLSRLIIINSEKLQFDCPNCETHIQINKNTKCPICGYLTKIEE